MITDVTPALDARDLQQAFLVFDDASRQLADSYHELQEEVSRLGAEVVAANVRLSEQLREKQSLAERLAGLLSALPVGVLVLDAAGKVTETNATALALLGQPLMGISWAALVAGRLEPGDDPGEWRTRQGCRRIALTECDLAEGAGRIVVAADTTERHAMGRALARSQRLAAMGAMSASLAHQLRTPLASALLYASQLGRAEIAAADQARFSAEIVSRLRDLEKFITGTLDFVSGRGEFRDNVDLPRLAAEARRLVAPQMERAGVMFEFDVPPGKLQLRASREALLAMLLNLLDNAQRACSPGGNVNLVVRRSGADAVLSVGDDGCGMTPDVLARLYEPYFTTRSDGHGLGLAFVRSVVEACRGRMVVDSAEGRGTRFTVIFPLAGNEQQGADE